MRTAENRAQVDLLLLLSVLQTLVLAIARYLEEVRLGGSAVLYEVLLKGANFAFCTNGHTKLMTYSDRSFASRPTSQACKGSAVAASCSNTTAFAVLRTQQHLPQLLLNPLHKDSASDPPITCDHNLQNLEPSNPAAGPVSECQGIALAGHSENEPERTGLAV